MRLATWNVNSLNARMPRVQEWLELAGPDVLCMQETKIDDDAYPGPAFEAMCYERDHHGQGRWNG
ncbi:MAG: endonuclease/exonuclease/phosphatase family protein, partial [bacterium]|nr:endonuclease/exonuclease/phosphatase family protein [bacterium]